VPVGKELWSGKSSFFLIFILFWLVEPLILKNDSIIEQSVQSRKKEQSKESADFLISLGPDNNIPNPKD
jgi:hypothetical protein